MEPPVKKEKKDKENYISPAVFKEELKAFYDSGSEIVPNTLAEYVLKIAKGLSHARNFRDYSYVEEMVGDAVIKMYAALKGKKYSFNTNTNPFSYFTTIAWHAFINRIKKEKKHQETLVAYKEKTYSELLLSDEDGLGHIYIKPMMEDHDGGFSDDD